MLSDREDFRWQCPTDTKPFDTTRIVVLISHMRHHELGLAGTKRLARRSGTTMMNDDGGSRE